MIDKLIDPRDLTLNELCSFFIGKGLSRYRASQLFSFLHKHRRIDIDELTNFSRDFRKACRNWFYFRPIDLIQTMESIDSTKKFLYRLFDNNFVESVLLSNNERFTACISSQAGCKFGCLFCRTSSMGFSRNLYTSEIIEQFGHMNDYHQSVYGRSINNLVFMGMGEPLDNYENVIKAVCILSQSGGYEISRRRMTISTCGHIEGIRRLSDDKRAPQLAISLNSPEQAKREMIMPCAGIWKLENLIDAALDFSLKKKERVTLEYIMIRDFNDSLKDADRLLRLVKRKSSFKVNLIPCNPVAMQDFQPSPLDKILLFQKHLKANRLSAHLRQTKGEDILAACGQLACIKENEKRKY